MLSNGNCYLLRSRCCIQVHVVRTGPTCISMLVQIWTTLLNLLIMEFPESSVNPTLIHVAEESQHRYWTLCGPNQTEKYAPPVHPMCSSCALNAFQLCTWCIPAWVRSRAKSCRHMQWGSWGIFCSPSDMVKSVKPMLCREGFLGKAARILGRFGLQGKFKELSY